jgi:NADP-dependent 3-hydroxy acid dehydrogenase YdfG
LTKSLRTEVNPDDVLIVRSFPGRTASPMQAQVHSLEGKPYHPDRLIQPADIAAIVISALRLPRTAEITDVLVLPMLKG